MEFPSENFFENDLVKNLFLSNAELLIDVALGLL